MGRGMARRRAGRSPVRRAIRCAATAATALLIVVWPVSAQVNPTPTPGGTPVATPTPTDTPVPPTTPTATPAPTSTPVPTAAAPSHPVPKPAAPNPRPPAAVPKLLSPTAGSMEFTLASTAMTVSNLAFAGTSPVNSGTASLTVLHFTADSASLAGFTEKEPCQFSAGGTTWHVVHSMPAAQTATLGGPITLLATSLSYTPPAGPTVTFDATNLPPVGVLVPTGTLPQVELTATSLIAASMAAPQLSVSVATC